MRHFSIVASKNQYTTNILHHVWSLCSFGFSLFVLHKYAAEIAISGVQKAYVIGIIGRATWFGIYLVDVSAVVKHTHSERVLSFHRIYFRPKASTFY